MRMRNALSIVLVAVLLVGAAGCSRENQDWRSAQAADTIEGYDDFVAKHPQGEFAKQAKGRVSQLTEERDWERATVADTAEAYQQFLAQHADGKWAQEARIRIENFGALDVAKPPAAAGVPGETPPASPAAVSTPPASPPTPPMAAPVAAPKAAPPKPTPAPKPAAPKAAPAVKASPAAKAAPMASATHANGTHKVQLGAFSSEAKANQEWQRISKLYGELKSLPLHIASVQTKAGKLYRLQAVVPSEERGRAICSALVARKQACVSVRP